MSDKCGCVGSTIKLVTGEYLDLLDPDPSIISIDAIAQGLANTCRFGGQIRGFYSVAEHSVLCCDVAYSDGDSREVQIACLMHDATEAFLGDVVKPLKNELSNYAEIESRMERAIERRFGFQIAAYRAIVKEIDRAMLIAERKQLFNADSVTWAGQEGTRELDIMLNWWKPDDAYKGFLDYAKEYGVK